MKLSQLLKKWDLTSLKIKTPFLELEWQPKDEDKSAAWELYVELITRVSTQRLVPEDGDEGAALNSIYQIFPLTRAIIKGNGRGCINFARIAVVMLNQKIRPFTAKWHPRMASGVSAADRKPFRDELRDLQTDLRNYTRLLADLAGVEDLTDMEAL